MKLNNSSLNLDDHDDLAELRHRQLAGSDDDWLRGSDWFTEYDWSWPWFERNFGEDARWRPRLLVPKPPLLCGVCRSPARQCPWCSALFCWACYDAHAKREDGYPDIEQPCRCLVPGYDCCARWTPHSTRSTPFPRRGRWPHGLCPDCEAHRRTKIMSCGREKTCSVVDAACCLR